MFRAAAKSVRLSLLTMFRGSCTAEGSGNAVLLMPSGTDEARSITAGERRRKIIAHQETLQQPWLMLGHEFGQGRLPARVQA